MTTLNWQHIKTKLLLPSIICGLAATFYLYEFILQVSPAVLTQEMMREFGIGAAGVSSIAAFYFYAYTPCQLPAGMLYDRFGPRRVLSTAVIICAVGALIFGSTHSIFFASLGRFLMGVGSAFSFIGVLVLISRWFPARYFALLTGIAQAMSSVGAIMGQAPLAVAVTAYGWRACITYLGVVGIFLALLIYSVIRDQPPWFRAMRSHQSKGTSTLKGLREVLTSSQNWYTAGYAFCSWAPVVVFAELWGIAYLAETYNVSTTAASTAMAMMWIGIGIGSPFAGWWSDLISNRKLPLMVLQVIGLAAVLALLFVNNLSFSMVYVLLLLMGISAGGQSLSFGLIKDNNSSSVVGTAIGFNNMCVVAGGALLQPIAGLLIQAYWDGAYANGVPNYSSAAYHNALLMLPLVYILGMIMCGFFIRETYCRQIAPAYLEVAHD